MNEHVFAINLNEMTPEDLINKIKQHELPQDIVMQLLGSLFEVWSKSLHLSVAVFQHGSEQDPNFIEQFIRLMSIRHDLNEEQVMKSLKILEAFRANQPNTRIH